MENHLKSITNLDMKKFFAVTKIEELIVKELTRYGKRRESFDGS